MSQARSKFISDINGIGQAVTLEQVAAGAMRATVSHGVAILRRGILIASLIALETFIRERTTELLVDLGRWPASYEDLPQKFRDAALIHALPNIQRYATMLKRQKEDYEGEIIRQLDLMATNKGPGFAFTKFISGDHTGNISDTGIKDLLSVFQIADCWTTFRLLSADIGFGIPSVQQLLIDLISKRHRSAHAAGFVPAATDITELPQNLSCLGICFDTAMTSTIAAALRDPKDWAAGSTVWRDGVDVYFVEADKSQHRVKKLGAARAIARFDNADQASLYTPKPKRGRIALLVKRSAANLPEKWEIVI